MSNLWSAELYRWRRSRFFYYCLLAAVAMVAVVWMSFWFADQINTGQMENGAMGVTVIGEVPDSGGEESLFETFSIMDMVQTFVGGGVCAIFVAIIVCLWVIGGYTDGAVKNVVGKGYSRNSIFLVKYCSAVLVSMALNLVMFVALVLMGMLIMGTGGIDGQFWKDFLAYTGLELMFAAALGGIIVAISEFVRNMAAGVSISIFAVFFTKLIVGGLDLFFRMLKIDFLASDYWITSVIESCPAEGIGMDFVGRALSVTVMWIVISLFVGMVHFHEADV